LSKVRQITFAALLDDPVYEKWFEQPPLLDRELTRWRVYAKLKRKDPWRKADFAKWTEAHAFVAAGWREWYDCALVCRNHPHRPPVVRVGGKRHYHAPLLTIPNHQWCPYCRRPTVFAWFTQHHAFTTISPLPWRKRCGVCGIAQEAIKRYQP
jgi:hypothetical protein